MQTLESLNKRYALPKHLSFRQDASGLIVADIANEYAVASVALQGGHVMSFQPLGQEPVIWLSPLAKLAPGKSIRGGVPICWPWFGPHATDAAKPGHGHARTVPWEVLEATAFVDGSTHLRLGLIESDATRAFWPHATPVQVLISVGRELRVELLTRNDGSETVQLGEALHTYLHISDIDNLAIRGLDGGVYLDKVDGFAQKTQHGDVAIAGEVDRVYIDTEADCLLEDRGLKRAIRVAKQGSRSTVVWNPGVEKAEKMGDFGPDGHRRMVCVESANALGNAVTLVPGAEHRLVAVYSVEPLAS
ncbi:MAG: D-hexose-6-phosphate mutarotase [Burkholderiales bacterium]